ncbi:TetR/AcrR family transcriptional regulator [Alteromonas oceanisediminis]|uniref:TetR/AcrR family transcriptional regulator n=1 Tax=Alteromonas oceanisediminis TaxID=2836180 RepID=UPI001BDAC6CD|nr:TetR/AcrR family transcriptional regulator [Alteromonas oceanisediminis]MBT0586445.1 TetR/AcrR family transcriptional regulator [Alteromonas oceanisediminis]
MNLTTKQRIIIAAESLFANHGFENTSLRMITQQAGVNLASVNYHFGSKKNLIQAVLARYFDVAIPHVDHSLEALDAATTVTVNSLVESIANALLEIEKQHPNGMAIFVQLLGRGYSETQGHLRTFILTHYGNTIHTLRSRFQSVLPHVETSDLFWRLHFALGSFVFSMSSHKALCDIAQSDFDTKETVSSIVHRLVSFVSMGIEAGRSR